MMESLWDSPLPGARCGEWQVSLERPTDRSAGFQTGLALTLEMGTDGACGRHKPVWKPALRPRKHEMSRLAAHPPSFAAPLSLKLKRQQLLRAGHHHVIARGDAFAHEPTSLRRMIQGDLDAREGIARRIQHVSPTRSLRPHHCFARDNHSGQRLSGNLEVTDHRDRNSVVFGSRQYLG